MPDQSAKPTSTPADDAVLAAEQLDEVAGGGGQPHMDSAAERKSGGQNLPVID